MPPPGPNKTTLADVAREAGVSVMTASYAYSTPSRVSVASRRKVLAAAEALGYPGPDPRARSLRKGSSGSLGVVLGETLPYAFDDPQATRFLAGIADVCSEHGLAMSILPANGSGDDSRRIQAAAVDGFIVWTTTDDDPVLAALALTGKPVVIHAGPERSAFGLIGIDDREAARAIAEVGIRGSHRPAIISFPATKERSEGSGLGPDPLAASFPVTRNRLLGYRDALTAAGFAWDRIEVASCPLNSFAEGERAALRLLGRTDPPDVILAMSDELALGVLRAAAVLGITVPDSLAVTGWDAASTGPAMPLTSVSQSLRDQGAQCARAVIAGEPESRREPWHLVIGQTTRPV